MRKYLSLLLASLMILTVGLTAAGCDKQGAGDKITLNFWHIHTSDTRKVPIQEAVQRFMDANPGVTVNIQVLENDPYKTKLKTVTGDEFPDVFHSWGGGWLKSFIDAGMVADISTSANTYKDKISEGAFNLNVFDGKTYGLPLFPSSTILYYNKAIFADNNLEVPTTFDELNAVADKLIEADIIPFALGNKSMWPGAQHFVMLSMRLGGPDIFQKAIDGEVPFTDPTFIKAGEMLTDMVKKGYYPEGVNGINYDTGGSRAMFYKGQCAMILQTSGFLASCRSEDPDFYANKLGIALYPSIADGKGKSTDILGGENALSVSSSSKNADMATKLVAFLATDITLQKTLVANGTLTALKGVEATDALVKQAMDQLANATYQQNFIDQTLTPELAEIHKSSTQGLFGETTTAAEAAKTMQDAYDAAKK